MSATSPEAIARRITQRREHHGSEDHDAALLEALAARLAKVEAERDAIAQRFDPDHSDPALMARIIMKSIENEVRADTAEAERDTALAQVATADIRALPLPTPARTYEDGVRDALAVDWARGKDVTDSAPEYLSDWQRGFVAGQTEFRAAILALIAKEPDNG